jgi:hypothetical protein
MRMPCAPIFIAVCTARFSARRKPTRRSSCWAMFSATSWASISGLRISTMLRCKLAVGQPRHLLAQLLDVGALLADDHARPRGVDRHPALAVRALDHDAADAGLRAFLLDELADLEILVEQLAVFLGVGVPAAVPGAVDLKAQADRIDFVTHQACSSWRTLIVSCANGFSMRPIAAAAARAPALHDQVLADPGLGHDQVVDVEPVIVLGVGDRALQRLLHLGRDAALGEGQIGQRLGDRFLADHRGDEVQLARTRADHLVDRHRLVFGDAAGIGFLAHAYLRFAFLSAACP